MKEESTSVEELLKKAEAYSITSLELIRLKSIAKTADVLSYATAHFVFLVFIAVFAMLFNIGMALWLGELMGRAYYGFIMVALFYGFLSLLIYIFRSRWIKDPVNNAIITRFLKK